jgi:hypothetical protein
METKFNEVSPESESDKSRRCCCKHHKFATVILLVLFAGIACWHIHRPRPHHSPLHHPSAIAPKPGTLCTVQFRRDSLGAASNLPIPPTTNIVNGSAVSIQGELIFVSPEAILLDQVNAHYIVNGVPNMKRFWIPKSSILAIEYEPERTFLDLPPHNILRAEYEATQRIKATENP